MGRSRAGHLQMFVALMVVTIVGLLVKQTLEYWKVILVMAMMVRKGDDVVKVAG